MYIFVLFKVDHHQPESHDLLCSFYSPSPLHSTPYSLSLLLCTILSVLVHSKHEVLLCWRRNLVRRLHIIASVIDRSDFVRGRLERCFLIDFHDSHSLTREQTCRIFFGRSLIPFQEGKHHRHDSHDTSSRINFSTLHIQLLDEHV